MLFRRFSLVAVLALGGLLGVACGDDDDGGGGVGGGGGGGDFCDQARGIEEAEDADLTDEESFDEAIEQLRDVADSAPDEIQDDVQVFLDALESFQEGDFEGIDEEEFDEAARNLEEYLEEECGIEST